MPHLAAHVMSILYFRLVLYICDEASDSDENSLLSKIIVCCEKDMRCVTKVRSDAES